MHPFLILAIAAAIVLLGILLLRMHAFVALLLAALTVAWLTPHSALENYAESQVKKQAWTEKQAEKFMSESTPGSRVAEGFGKTCASIGILIAMASIIGKCLLDSGAADRIVRTSLKLVGEARAGAAFLGSGFLLGIPVFFDTVFYLMIPLGKAAALRTGKNYLLFILTIVAGATMSHSLVPPTPGPLIVVEQLKVNLLSMLVGGCIVGLFASCGGYLFAAVMNRRMTIPLRDSPDAALKDLQKVAARKDEELPSLFWSLMPILLPVVLIAVATALDMQEPGSLPNWLEMLRPTVMTLGDKNVALTLAAGIGLGLLMSQGKQSELSASVQAALAGGGIIILITSAGGAFGAAILQSGVAEEIAGLAQEIPPWTILPAAFLVTTLIRTAQGSATVAMITAAGVLQGLVSDPSLLPYDRVYLALAIGCGSKPIAWMADSGFWVICKMSGMTEAEALKTITPMSIVMGLCGLIAVMIGAAVFPLK